MCQQCARTLKRLIATEKFVKELHLIHEWTLGEQETELKKLTFHAI